MKGYKILAVNDIADMGKPYATVLNGDIRNVFTGMFDKLEEDLNWCDLVLYCGGSDVSTVLYREPRNGAYSNDYSRDLYEIGIYNRARALNKYQVGICRGFQFLAVMNGHKLQQHINGHEGSIHSIKIDGKNYLVNSYHHQAVLVEDNPAEFHYFNGKEFGVQWHPEHGGTSLMAFQKLLSFILE